MSKERPLATLAVFAYSQETYVLDAINGAFSQTYQPLEIVLSDDCSPDGTYALMERAAADYDGPHKLVLNRNEKNLGIGGHVRRLAELASGEIIIMAAGDDVSLPGRVSTMVEAFEGDPPVMAVFSDINHVDDDGAFLHCRPAYHGRHHSIDMLRVAKSGGGVGPGAGYAYRRRCFEWPGPYPDHLKNEDRILPFRAALLGGVRYLPTPLVNYRSSVTGASRSLEASQLFAMANDEHLANLLETIDHAARSDMVSERLAARLGNEVRRSARYAARHILLARRGGRIGRLLRSLLYHWRFRDEIPARIGRRLRRKPN